MLIKEYLQYADMLQHTVEMMEELRQQIDQERNDFDRMFRPNKDPSRLKRINDFHSINDRLRDRINGHIDRAQKKHDFIVAMIAQVQPEITQQIITAHFLEGATLAQCAERFYYCDKTIQIKIKKGLDQMQAILDAAESIPA